MTDALQVPADLPLDVEIRRSARRRRTVSAYREGGRTILLVPAGMSKSDEAHWARVMIERLEKQERRRSRLAQSGDAELLTRALELSQRWLGGVAIPVSVRWVDNQNSRWGSCTPADGTIRLSDRLKSFPTWVVDYVLIHELAHLLYADHGPKFQALVRRYPKAERARGFLEGVLVGARLPEAELGCEGEDW
jgi:predicted metal-dependent hydrolase